MHVGAYMPDGRNPVKLRAWQETSGHINRIPKDDRREQNHEQLQDNQSG